MTGLTSSFLLRYAVSAENGSAKGIGKVHTSGTGNVSVGTEDFFSLSLSVRVLSRVFRRLCCWLVHHLSSSRNPREKRSQWEFCRLMFIQRKLMEEVVVLGKKSQIKKKSCTGK